MEERHRLKACTAAILWGMQALLIHHPWMHTASRCELLRAPGKAGYTQAWPKSCTATEVASWRQAASRRLKYIHSIHGRMQRTQPAGYGCGMLRSIATPHTMVSPADAQSLNRLWKAYDLGSGFVAAAGLIFAHESRSSPGCEMCAQQCVVARLQWPESCTPAGHDVALHVPQSRNALCSSMP